MKEHLCSERFVVEACATGELSIDEEGHIWRHKVRKGTRSGSVCLADVPKRRAEACCDHGYLQVRRDKNKKHYAASAARLVWQYFYGDIPDNLCINHKNGIKDDNRPENLELVTYQGNMLHAVRAGLLPKGECHCRSKLRDLDVLEIRQRYKYGDISQRELAKNYGVTHKAIGYVLSGHTWKHLAGALAR